MVCIASIVSLTACGDRNPPSTEIEAQSLTPLVIASPAFQNAVNTPPDGWAGHVFELSHDYPVLSPLPPADGYPWEAFDFESQPGEYMQAVLDFARHDLEAIDWDPTTMDRPTWFHAPWMAYGNNGSNAREFIQGMTKERSSRTGELGPGQTTNYISNYAVGLYNDVAGATFGRVWADPSIPNIADGNANFANGAMGIKLLFTQADPDVPADGVPYLRNSKEWQANIAKFSSNGTNPREPQTLRLLQVDIAVRDVRNDAATGWLFGTFVYNGNKLGESPFDRLAPVGLMWGDSPGFLPADAEAGETPPEQWINTDVGTYQHLGWAKRINGPVDNPASSCMSCHGGAAESPVSSPMIPPSNLSDEEKLAWFTNIKAGEARDEGSISLDYSLQMSVALQSWRRWMQSQPQSQSTTLDTFSLDAKMEDQREYPVNRGDDPRD